MRTIIILSVTSDIGFYLAQSYLRQGHRVVGTYRSSSHLDALKNFSNCILVSLDIHDEKSIKKFLVNLKRRKIFWDTFISAVGEPRPLTAFFKSDFNKWKASVEINSIDQLRVIHGLFPLKSKKANIVFFAGGGINNAVVDFSAYTIGKIMLTKMCEFLDKENSDVNIFIVGPGWTKTKTHQLILNDSQVSKQKWKETSDFCANCSGTKLEDIFLCIEWLCAQGKKVASGRNFSVVDDHWRGPKRGSLRKALLKENGMYKLKRHLNDFMKIGGSDVKS